MKNQSNNTFQVFGLRAVLFICVSLFLLLSSPGEGDTDRKEHFRQGRINLEALHYSEAVSNLSLAQKEFPLLEDYTLYYLAEAYHGMGDHQKSLESIRSLLEKYAATPLRKRARMAEIREAKEVSGDVIKLYEAYIKDYQTDEAALYFYGKALKEAGNTAKASAVFKKIYIGAGEFSSSAFSEFKSEDLTSKDIIERASNQFRRYDFAEAEQDLRQALSKDDGSCRTEILKNLGYSLFKQKKYIEAAEVFGRVDDFYYRARSLYRAGDKKGFESAFENLIKSKDRQAGSLFNAIAADKRREKDFDGAIKIYNDVLNNYPSDAEEALWGIGWTQYISGDFAKSAVTFAKLHGKYDDLKYLYWQAKSLDADGKNSTELYSKLMRAENSFYAFMAYTTNKTPLKKPVALNQPMFDISRDKIRKSERIEAMISLDMQKEALIELSFVSRKIDTPDELVYIITKLQELGDYKRAISLASQIPYSENMHKFWYPLAYWDRVEPIAKKHNIDPFVALSVIREESRFDANAKSAAGAYGLMQLMPETAYRLDRSLKLGINRPSQLTVIGNNIQLGSFYLRALFNDFHSLPHVLAAYNAGERVVKMWQARGNYRSVDEFIEDIPYAETRNYVKKVLTSYFQYKRLSSVDRGGADLDIILGGL